MRGAWVAAAVLFTCGQVHGQWTTIPVPSLWQEHKIAAPTTAWLRCWAKIPADWKGSDVTLNLDKLHHAFEVYWDGVKFGEAGAFPPKARDAGNDFFSFTLPEKAVKPGAYQLLAIRVHGMNAKAGFGGLSPALVQESLAISLEGKWQFRVGDDLAWAKPNEPRPEGGASFAKVQPTASLATPDRKAFGGLKPAEAVKALKTPDDLRVDQILAEPIVRQPLSLSFDERGRLWVVQYLQYPHPAGLKMLSRDIWWRAVYDKVPPPPPNHFRGKDVVTIHEDADGDGVYETHSTFVEGLNIATAAARGRGGVWILNPPYLLFYPTKNNADRPTGDPVVHLTGFGIEDTHSVANSLQFGPDGWLYGAQGSTVTAEIRRPGDKNPVRSVGQNLWRYHPEKRVYEVFAEGGGNAFGIDIDREGRTFSGHNGGNTRGFHYVQGGYYRKGFDKHGALSNAFAFGFFENMKHASAPRFSHTFVTNESTKALPAHYRHKLFAVSPLQSQVVYTDLFADGSSLQTKDLGVAIGSSDAWFRPVDIKQGPDGAIYVADWYDGQLAHTRNHEGNLDGDTGRIYRLAGRDFRPGPTPDLGKKTSAELTSLLASDDRWTRTTALRLLGDRKDRSQIPALEKALFATPGEASLGYLWGLHVSGGLREEVALRALRHPVAGVRRWTARLVGDENRAQPTLAAALAEAAQREPDVTVRSQLASTARRLPPEENLPIVRALLGHSGDTDDVHLPLLLWWAIERACTDDPQAVLRFFDDPAVWRTATAKKALVTRTMRRFALAGTQKDLAICTQLFRRAPDAESGKLLIQGLEEAFKGRSIAGLPAPILDHVAKLGGGSLVFAVRQGRPEAVAKALATIADPKATLDARRELVDVFAEARQPQAVPALLQLLDGDASLRAAALGTLQAYPDAQIARVALIKLPKWDAESREFAEGLLASRKEWTRLWLEATEAGAVDREKIPMASVRRMMLHKDPAIDGLVKRLWGDVKGATTAQMQVEIGRLGRVVASGLGNPYNGKKLFTARCASCHTLHSKGGQVGPDLTPYKRDDAANLLLHIVNPSAEIREGYENHVVVTESGRILTGVVLEKDVQTVVLRTAEGQKVALARSDVSEMRVVGASLMPEGLLQGLADPEVRDLFAYLRSTQPLYDR